MAETTVELNPGNGGAKVVVDRIDSKDLQVIKLALGAIGANDGPVSSGNPMPVAGTVNLGAVDNAVLDAIQAACEAIETAVEGTLTVGSHAVTNAGTFAVQVDGAALTALQAIETAVEGTLTVQGTITANLGSVDNAVLDDIAAKLTTIDADTSALSGTVDSGAVTVKGTVDLGSTDNGVLDDIAAKLAGTGTIGLAAGSQTIGTVDLGSTDNAVLDAIQAASEAIQTAVEGTLTVTGAGGGTEYDAGDNLSTDPTGKLMLLSKDDVLSSILQTDNSAVAARCNAFGALWTVEYDPVRGRDDGTFSAGTSYGVPAMGFVTTDTVDSGDAGALAMTAARELHVTGRPTATGTSLNYYVSDGADDDAEVVKASAGIVTLIHASNVDSTDAYIKLYNKATAPSVGSDTPVAAFIVPPGGVLIQPNFPLEFSTGISFVIVEGAANTNSDGVDSAQVTVTTQYK